MAQLVGPFRKVGELISLFMQMGCELRTTSRVVVRGPHGQQVEQVRFLFNPETGGYFPLGDLQDDERVPPSEVQSWERRLGMEVPKPSTIH